MKQPKRTQEQRISSLEKRLKEVEVITVGLFKDVLQLIKIIEHNKLEIPKEITKHDC